MDVKLKGAAVLVTGGGRGIGREIALAFAGEGADVAICGRSAEHLDATRAELAAFGVSAFSFATDLTDPGAGAEMVDQAAAALGRLQVLINNAANDVLTSDKVSNPILERFLGKTMLAVECADAAVPHLISAGGGSIVMIGGTSARQPFSAREMGTKRSTTASGVSNAALVNYAKHLAVDVMPSGIRVNVVHPHFTRTDRYLTRVGLAAESEGLDLAAAEAFLASPVPAGRLPEPADIAPLVVLLASPLTSMVTGQSIAVDGGTIKSILY